MSEDKNKNLISPHTPDGQSSDTPRPHPDGLPPVRQKANVGFATPQKQSRLKRLWRERKAAVIIGSLILVSLLGGGSLLAYRAFNKPTQPSQVAAAPESTPTPTPTPIITSLLTGVEVSQDKANQPIMASIVENLGGVGGARPQSGLSSAGVIYEALAEGGITRYLALFQADVPADIGPVRSLRPVFFDTAMEYGAPVAHAGGSSDALASVRNNKTFKDLDQFYNGAYFRRINSRYAPHNLYIYGPKLTELVTKKGWNKPPTFAAWPRKDDAPSATPNATSITANFSSPMYLAQFSYDKASNSYARTLAGQADVDAVNKQRIKPKTVIAIYAATAGGVQRNGKPKTDIDIIGTGKGVIFQDGIATPMTWTKPGLSARMSFKDSSGAEIKLNRGQSWVCILPSDRPATYK